MSSSEHTVLSWEQRARLAVDDTVGGGNLLRAAIAASPHPELPFIRSARPLTHPDGRRLHELSMLDLDTLAQSWSVWYFEQGVRPRDRVAVHIEDSLAYWVHFYALAQIGAVAVLINCKAPSHIVKSLCEQTQPVGLYTDQERLDRLGADTAELTTLNWIKTEEELPAPPWKVLPESARFRHVASDPVAVLHSSGTTGKPKPTIHTHRSIVSGPKFRLVDHKESATSLTMTALPQSHLGCIAYTTYAVLAGARTVALRDSTGEELAAAVTKYQPTAVMSFAHAYAELAALDLPEGAVDSVNVWISLGDAVHRSHVRKLLSQRSERRPAAVFFDRLGTTELGWGVLLKTWTLDSARKDRCAGQPVGVADVVVLRPDGTQAGPNEIGLLGARGPAITPGYWNNSDITFRSMLSGYWLTGDNAYRDENGDHYLVDRSVDAIETPAGTGFSVFMEEAVLTDVPEIVDCAIVAGHHKGRIVPVAVVTTPGADVAAEKLLRMANDALQAAGHPRLGALEVVTQSDADFPVGVTGKVLKRFLREKYSALEEYVLDKAGDKLAVDIAG
jgi:acyl-coenzyme A synthetase/AMP-(fatty) acid ligase